MRFARGEQLTYSIDDATRIYDISNEGGQDYMHTDETFVGSPSVMSDSVVNFVTENS